MNQMEFKSDLQGLNLCHAIQMDKSTDVNSTDFLKDENTHAQPSYYTYIQFLSCVGLLLSRNSCVVSVYYLISQNDSHFNHRYYPLSFFLSLQSLFVFLGKQTDTGFSVSSFTLPSLSLVFFTRFALHMSMLY